MARTASEWKEYLAETGYNSALCREIVKDFEELEQHAEALLQEAVLVLLLVRILLEKRG